MVGSFCLYIKTQLRSWLVVRSFLYPVFRRAIGNLPDFKIGFLIRYIFGLNFFFLTRLAVSGIKVTAFRYDISFLIAELLFSFALLKLTELIIFRI